MNYDLASVLRAEGLTVEEDPGWRGRSNGGVFVPEGIVVHHTAIGAKASDANVTKILREGRPDLRGMLSQMRVKRNGVVVLIGLGKAYHAGPGSAAVLAGIRKNNPPKGSAASQGLKDTERNGNTYLWGIECDNDGVGEGWPTQQVQAIARVCAAICRAEGWPSDRVIGHAEWTARKIDPRGISMPSMRIAVAAALGTVSHTQAGPLPVTPAARPLPTWEAAAVASLPVIGKGAGGNAPNGMVKRLQGLLLANGHSVTVDGLYGPNTAKSVKAFQTKHKIGADGVCGRQTWTKLLGL